MKPDTQPSATPPTALQSPELRTLIERLLRSHKLLCGTELVEPGPLELRVELLFAAPFVALAHDAATEPVYNFGNALALKLWEMSWKEFTALPSNRCAEPVHRAERKRFLEEVERKGFADGYSGIRVSKSGRRFKIQDVRCWNILDEQGQRVGQAARYPRWSFL